MSVKRPDETDQDSANKRLKSVFYPITEELFDSHVKDKRLSLYVPAKFVVSYTEMVTMLSFKSVDAFKTLLKTINIEESYQDTFMEGVLASLGRITVNSTQPDLVDFLKYSNLHRFSLEKGGENRLLASIPAISGLVFKSELFLRDCFFDLYDIIRLAAEQSCLAVIGDPGIGKSSFSTYVFMRLINEGVSVAHISQGGACIYYDSKSRTLSRFDSAPRKIWIENDTHLLLDGRIHEIPFADKKNKAIVFASMNNKIAEFVKESQLCLVMPPWTLEEFNSTPFSMQECNGQSIVLQIPIQHFSMILASSYNLGF